MSSRPGPDAAKQARPMILPPSFTDGIRFLGMQCLSFSKHNASHLNQKSSILVSSIHKKKNPPITLWLVHMIFIKLQTGSNVLFGEHWFSLCNSIMHTMVVQCSPHDRLRNITLGNMRNAFGRLEVNLGSFANRGLLHVLLLEWSLFVDHS